MHRKLIAFAGLSGTVGVALGALGAHALKGPLGPDQLDSFETAVNYHLFHTLAILIVALLPSPPTKRLFKVAGYLFVAGILLFSGSIYLLSTRAVTGLEGIGWLGPVTPLGGMLLIAGWVTITIGALKRA